MSSWLRFMIFCALLKCYVDSEPRYAAVLSQSQTWLCRCQPQPWPATQQFANGPSECLWAATYNGVAPSMALALFLSTPASTSKQAILVRHSWAATYKGVAPVSVVAWSISALALTSTWATCKCPTRQAIYTGVAPSRSGLVSICTSLKKQTNNFGMASLSSDAQRNCTIFCSTLIYVSTSLHQQMNQSQMARAARWKDVSPVSVLLMFPLAPALRSNRTASRCCSWAAICKGVAPWSVVALSISTPALTSKWTTCRRPLRAAMCSGVAPSPVLALLLSAPFSISKPATSQALLNHSTGSHHPLVFLKVRRPEFWEHQLHLDWL